MPDENGNFKGIFIDKELPWLKKDKEIKCRLCGIGFSPDRMQEKCLESTTGLHEFFDN